MSGLLPKHTLFDQLSACVAYGGVSISITLFNKAIFSTYHFTYPNLVTLGQILITLTLIRLLSARDYVEVSPMSRSALRKLFPLTVAWWIYVLSGVTALRYLSVPMYGLLRRGTTLAVVAGEYAMFGKVVSRNALGAIAIMMAGALIGVSNDLSFNPLGYLYIAVCCASTALYLLLIRKLKGELRVNETTLLFYNNVLSLPIMVVYLLFFTNEVGSVLSFPHLTDVRFQALYLVAASQGFLLNLCIFRCTTVNSPLTTNITGMIKEVLTTALGLVIFGDYVWNAKNVLGVVVGLAGGITYSAVGYAERHRKVERNTI